MLVRLLCALPILLFVGSAHATCDSSASEPVETARARFERTQAALDVTPADQRETPRFRALQERALGELERLQCAIEGNAPPESVTRAPAGPTPYASIPILFITDRTQTKSSAGVISFNGDLQSKAPGTDGVSYGKTTIRLPAENFEEGSTLPRGITITTKSGASERVAVGTQEIVTRDRLAKALEEYKAGAQVGPVRVLLFIHGFNVNHDDALKAVARLAWGLRINLLPIAITWPSQGEILRYWQDEQAIEPTVERLRPIFEWLLNNSQVDEVIIVAHSMGARLVTRELSDLNLQKTPLTKLVRVTFAAADLPDEQFIELWPRLTELPSKGWLLYTSSNDIALLASRVVHGKAPVGDSRSRVFSISPA
ncbi:MAG: alpha/beta hydrolase, partial [Terriglobales bacterium]